jgi:hypothetical protein
MTKSVATDLVMVPEFETTYRYAAGVERPALQPDMTHAIIAQP